MKKQYHILNGDSLKAQFPESIQGEIIVLRECLVDGSVKGDSLTAFFKTRAKFIGEHYEGFSEQDYLDNTVPELLKIQNIPAYADINLWFEDDLFCQVNFWFAINLLRASNDKNTFFLIRPKLHTQYGFGGLNTSELISIYDKRLALSEMDALAGLWKSYQLDDTQSLMQTAKQLKTPYPFILNAVEAHMERIPTHTTKGKPSEVLIQIMDELDTVEFGAIFREFCKRAPIYGFGDLQVKRLFDLLIDNR